MEQITLEYNGRLPVIPLRGLVLLPGELLHFDAGRLESLKAIAAAMESNSIAFITCQKDAKKNEVDEGDIFTTGCIARIKKVPATGDTVRVYAQGLCRAEASDFMRVDYFSAKVRPLAEVANIEDAPLIEALRRSLGEALMEFAPLSGRLTPDAAENISKIPAGGALADAVANTVLTKTGVRQSVLETLDIAERMKLVLTAVTLECEVVRIDRRIQQEVKRAVDKNQKEYYLREQIKAIKKELGETGDADADGFLERLKEKKMPDSVREALTREITRYRELPQGSHEQPQMRSYIECMLELPWLEETEDNTDLDHAREVLEHDHYGLEKVKKRIVEYIAVARLTGKVNGQIICLVGPPGVGKTSIASSIARALGRNFVRMSLGGIHDEAEIRGHRRTYIGAMPGRVIAAMRKAKSVNPVMLFDEIDKLTSDMRGDPAAAMLEVLDSAQNNAFRDHFLETEYDRSKAMFIVTANTTETIPAPRLDRMEVIELPSYLEYEKTEIAKRHLLPKQMEKHGLTKSRLSMTDDAMRALIRGYTREAGVRELERELAGVCRKAACDIGDGKARVRVTPKKLLEYMGTPRYTSETAEKNDAIGMVNGLAWTSFGGETLEVEALIVPGSGQVILTGKLGDVMQESARAALTYIKANAKLLGIDATALDKKDIHIHVPEGAVPKDGPSAGVTIMTAMASALTGIPVRADLAMTGELTLRGRVLPIGGLREKLLAASKAGITHALVPEKNRKDMEEVPEEVKAAIEVRFVSDAKEVLSLSLTHMPKSTAEDAVVRLDAEDAVGGFIRVPDAPRTGVAQ